MATQYSNKPIVTNGLVYALDFGNQKSYVSGSSSARSLLFNPLTASVSGSPTFTATGLLNLSSTSNVLTNKTFSELTINNSYTVSTLVQVKSGGTFWNQDASPSADASSLNTTSTAVGHLVTDSTYLQGSDFRRGFNANLSQLTHITYRNYSGSFDVFINGVPVNTTGDVGLVRGGGLNLNGRSNGDSFWSGSIGNFYIYNRALTSDEIYSNYLLTAQRFGLRTTPKPYTVDENAYLFLSQSGIIDPIITSSIDTFVKGLKANNLWGKMAVIYPFVGTGSVGVNLTGSHKINLKEPGIYPFTYSGAWNGSISGSAPSGSGTYIDTGVSPQSRFPYYVANNYHMSILSYDTPVSSSILAGTGMTKELAVSTLAGDYGTPAAAYSVRKVRTAYSGALMDVRRDYDNTTGSVGYVSNGDLDTGSLLDFVIPGRSTLPGNYSGLAAAYSLRRVSSSYTGSAIDVRRDSDNYIFPIGFTGSGGLDTQTLLQTLTTGSNIMPYSNDITQFYAKDNVQITSSAISGPFGIGSGSFLNETSANSRHAVFDYLASAIGGTYNVSAFVKKQERRYVALANPPNGSNNAYVVFDLNTTSSISSGSAGTGFSVLSSSIHYVDNGWFRLSFVSTTGRTDFYPSLYTQKTPTFDVNGGYVGEPGTGSYVYGFQYSSGSILQPYIETTGSARYNQPITNSMGYVTQWYDQSGNARHATQTTAGSQPLMVSSGSLITENGKPAVQFDNIRGTRLKSPAFTGGTVDSSFLVVRTNVQNQVFLDGDTTNNIRFYNTPTADSLDVYAGNTDIQANIFTLNKQHLVSTIISGSNSILAVDNNVRTGINLGTNVRNGVTIGAHGDIANIGNAFTGNFQEVVIFNTNQSASKSLIENNINTYYSIYTSSAAGYVAKWYDQSGNNNHAVMTVTSSQPQIVSSGSTISVNQRSAIYNNSTSLNLTTPLSLGDFTVLWVTKRSVTVGSSGGILGTITAQESLMGDNTDGGGTPTAYRSAIFIGTSTSNSSAGGTENLQHLSYLNRRNGTQAVGQLNNSNNNYNNSVTSANFRVEAISNYRSDYNFLGHYQEIIIYSTDKSTFRDSISYGINNYYNIYPQTSSFSTSSFTIYATTSSISASINNELQSGIASSGPLGFITVSRTGSNALTLSKNGVTSSFSVPASGALSTNLYLGAINNNGIALGSSPYNISFASVGVGLTGNETKTLNSLVRQLQVNLQRLPSTYTVSSYPNAIAAFSIRKLATTYTGSAFEVRRSSDNTTLSIGFNSYGNLDTATLLSFVGTSLTSTGYVTQWYDQSGNNNHISQSTAASQPVIVWSGSVVTAQTFQTRQTQGPNGSNNNILPAIYFNGRTLELNRTLYSTNQISYYTVFNLGLSENTSIDGYSVMATNTEAGGSGWSWYSTGGGPSGYINMFQQAGSSRRESFPGNMPKGGTVLYSGYHTGSAYTVYVNNTLKGTDTSQQFGSGSFLRVGAGNQYQFAGSIQELVFYATGSTANNAGIQDSINAYYEVY